MKKLSYLLVPLMALPFVVGCGKGGGDNDGGWYTDTKYLNSLTIADIGTTQTVKVNGVDHIVRLIGIDHDELAGGSGKKAHTTWEFANLISDENGYSLATFWNDAKRSTSSHPCPCSDYFNSSVRYALVGEGDPVSHGWYEMSARKKSRKYTKPVIEMLPKALVKKIKSVKKTVISFADGDDPQNANNYVPMECDDKLFMLSYKEISKEDHAFAYRDIGKLYAYYDSADVTPIANQKLRIKRHFASNETIQGVTEATAITDSKQGSPVTPSRDTIDNIAGFNSTATRGDVHCGSGYWLRDLCPNGMTVGIAGSTEAAPACVSSGGDMCVAASTGNNHGDGNELAAPIAPAFCL